MRTLLVKTIAVSIILTLTTCKKNKEKVPSAKYDFDKSQYFAGETINLINHSDNAARFRWTFPDGTTSTNTDVTYPTSNPGVAYNLTFKLEAFSESGSLSDLIVKSVQVTPPAGKLVLYSDVYGGHYVVYIDGVYKGEFQMPQSSVVPQCDQQGYPTFVLTPGTHVIDVAGWDNTTTTIGIVNGQCTKLKVSQ